MAGSLFPDGAPELRPYRVVQPAARHGWTASVTGVPDGRACRFAAVPAVVARSGLTAGRAATLPGVNAETESLACYLDEQRDRVPGIAGGVPEAALRRAVFPSGWTCLGLIVTWPSMTSGVAAGEPAGFPAGGSGLAGRARRRGREMFGPYRGEIARMPSSRRRKG